MKVWDILFVPMCLVGLLFITSPSGNGGPGEWILRAVGVGMVLLCLAVLWNLVRDQQKQLDALEKRLAKPNRDEVHRTSGSAAAGD
jgi:hypothetical protein